VSGALYLKIFAPLLKNFFRRPPPTPPVAKKIFGQCTILGVKKFLRTYHNFSERRKIFSGNTYDVYCHGRCLFIVIPYNRINLNHDRINLNLVGAPNFRGPLVLELTLTTVRYATVFTAIYKQNLLNFRHHFLFGVSSKISSF
jgi:hypothetical protein